MRAAEGLSADALCVLALPRDRSGFVRRQCAGCRRHFKSKPSLQDGLALQRYLAQRLPHEDTDGGGELDHARCPYCGRAGAAEEWLTLDQRTRLDRLAQGLHNHVQHAWMQQAGFALDPSARPTFLPVDPDPLPPTLGSEPDDLRVLHLVCCALDIKVQEEWEGTVHCPQCGTQHGRPVSRRRAAQLTFLRE
jgi:hypothetical protein